MSQLSLFSEPEEDPIPAEFSGVRREMVNGEWVFSIIDVISALTGSSNPRRYWTDLKRKLETEGSEVYENIVQLKLPAPDGKMRSTDVANMEQMLRIIQSVPSPNAEPFKVWMAQVAAERIEEERDPELGITRAVDRAVNRYQKLGKEDQWVQARLQGLISRRAFTQALNDAVQAGLADGLLFGQATGDMYKGVFHLSTKQIRNVLGLDEKDNLRDNLPRVALYFVAIAEELCARELGNAEMLTPSQARLIVRETAGMVGASVQYLQERMSQNLLAPGSDST